LTQAKTLNDPADGSKTGPDKTQSLGEIKGVRYLFQQLSLHISAVTISMSRARASNPFVAASSGVFLWGGLWRVRVEYARGKVRTRDQVSGAKGQPAQARRISSMNSRKRPSLFLARP
jgi:hypothetical protein